MSYTIVRPKDRDAWLEERKNGLGSSDAGTVMGVSPFSTPLKLWRLKMGIDPPVEETDAMRNGHWFEAATAQYFAYVTKSFVDPDTADDWLAVSNEKPFLRVSPDRLFYTEGVEHKIENALILELKSTSKSVDPDNIPNYWYCQVQYQMGVMGVKMAAVAWVSAFPTLHFGHTWIAFNEEFYKTLEGKLTEFWQNNILKGISPEPLDEEDVKILWPKAERPEPVIATNEDNVLISQYKQMAERLKEDEEEMSQITMKLKERIKDCESLVNDENGMYHTLITYRHNKKNVFDEDKFRAEEPEVYKRYLKNVLDLDELKSFDKPTFDKYNKVLKGNGVFKVL